MPLTAPATVASERDCSTASSLAGRHVGSVRRRESGRSGLIKRAIAPTLPSRAARIDGFLIFVPQAAGIRFHTILFSWASPRKVPFGFPSSHPPSPLSKPHDLRTACLPSLSGSLPASSSLFPCSPSPRHVWRDENKETDIGTRRNCLQRAKPNENEAGRNPSTRN